jgi:hypothetical protein
LKAAARYGAKREQEVKRGSKQGCVPIGHSRADPIQEAASNQPEDAREYPRQPKAFASEDVIAGSDDRLHDWRLEETLLPLTAFCNLLLPFRNRSQVIEVEPSGNDEGPILPRRVKIERRGSAVIQSDAQGGEK